jgi:hypothetical protein
VSFCAAVFQLHLPLLGKHKQGESSAPIMSHQLMRHDGRS